MISALDPATVVTVRADGERASTSIVDAKDIQTQVSLLDALGTTLGEVFGRSHILWVEGESEQEVFTRLARHVGARLSDTSIMRMVSTGDFSGSRRSTIIDLYQNMTRSMALVPSAKGFVFDRDNMNDADISKFRDEVERKHGREASKLLLFLERSMLENYLIHPESIASVLSSDIHPQTISAQSVRECIEAVRKESSTKNKLVWRDSDATTEQAWTKLCHGAQVLDRIFRNLTDSRCQYMPHKRSYAGRLVDSILDRDPTFMDPLTDMLRPLLGMGR